MSTQSLDTRGDICPVPLLKTVKKLGSMQSGDELIVISDHPPAKRSIPLEMDKRKIKYAIIENGPEFKIVITVT